MEEGADETTIFRERSPPLPSATHITIHRHLYTQAAIDETYKSLSPPRTVCEVIKDACRVSPQCVGKHALDFLPIIKTLRTYRWRQWILNDVMSGLSTGFMHLPQGLGFGLLASLRPANGLYSSFFPVLVYLLFGTSPHVSMGTNALMALLTASLVDSRAEKFLRGGSGDSNSTSASSTTLSPEDVMEYKVGLSTAACLVSGLILFVMGVARMGVLTNFLSKSLIGGFTFAAAVHISLSQVIKLLNIHLPGQSGLGKLVKVVIDLFRHIVEANLADVLVGLVCMAVLLIVKICINERFKHRLKVPIPIELIVVVVSTLISHFADLQGRFGLAIVGQVATGLPVPSVPPVGRLSEVASEAFVIAVLTFALSISLAKLTAKMHDVTIDNNQELVAYGMCQIVGAFFQNFPSCTAPPRTMVLSSLRSRSTLNGLAPALFLLLVVLVAGPWFQSLPIAMLAAMIIVAMKDLLMQIRTLKSLWIINKPDFLIWILTAAVGVFGDLDIGLLVGVVLSMVTVLLASQLAQGRLLGRAEQEDVIIDLDRKGVSAVLGVRIFRFDSALYYASLERFKSHLFTQVMNPTLSHPPTPPSTRSSVPPTTHPDETHHLEPTDLDLPPALANGKEDAADVIRHVVLDCGAMIYVDVAGAELLQTIVSKFARAGVAIWLADVPPCTLGTLTRAGLYKWVGKEKVVYSVFDALKILGKTDTVEVKL